MKSILRISLVSAVLAGFMLPIAGCSFSSGQPKEEPPIVFSGSVPKQYLDTERLASDSSDLVYGQIVSSSEQKIADLLVTRYELEIKETLGGTASGTVGVYQTGTPDWIYDIPLPQHLKVGSSFLLYLTPMGLPEGKVGSDGYAILGTGAWIEVNGAFEIYGNGDHPIEYGAIPKTLTLESARTDLSVDLLGASLPSSPK